LCGEFNIYHLTEKNSFTMPDSFILLVCGGCYHKDILLVPDMPLVFAHSMLIEATSDLGFVLAGTSFNSDCIYVLSFEKFAGPAHGMAS